MKKLAIFLRRANNYGIQYETAEKCDADSGSGSP